MGKKDLSLLKEFPDGFIGGSYKGKVGLGGLVISWINPAIDDGVNEHGKPLVKHDVGEKRYEAGELISLIAINGDDCLTIEAPVPFKSPVHHSYFETLIYI